MQRKSYITVFVNTGDMRYSLQFGQIAHVVQNVTSLRAVSRRLAASSMHSLLEEITGDCDQGSRKSSTQQQGQYVLFYVRKNRTNTARALQNIQRTTHVHFCDKTVRNILRVDTMTVQCPCVGHCAAQTTVLFTDKSRLTPRTCDGHESMWTCCGERYTACNFIQHSAVGQ